MVSLRAVDRVDVTVIVENSVDVFLADTDVAHRPPRAWDPAPGILRAEHGLSLLVRVEVDGRASSVLYDAGLGRDTVTHNLDVLGVSLADLRAIVLSHGHVDHFSGLAGIARRVGRRMPLVLHPHAWRERKLLFPDGQELAPPRLVRSDLAAEGIETVEERGPTLLLDDAVLVTGEVSRETAFERGFPLQHARSDGEWVPDPWVWDDQALVVNVRGRGLVVLSACSHAGIVNILRQALRATGVARVEALIGGMHLTSPIFEPLIPATVDELVRLHPSVIAPGHCTGWRAIHEIARRLPEAYVQTSVGTTFAIAAPVDGPSGAQARADAHPIPG